MGLRSEQSKFVRMTGALIHHATQLGYELTIGEAWRPDWVAREYARRGTGVYPSYHQSRLAIDWNVFRNGVWLKNTEDLAPLGEYWQSISGVWGGTFTTRKDGSHFSLGEGEDDR